MIDPSWLQAASPFIVLVLIPMVNSLRKKMDDSTIERNKSTALLADHDVRLKSIQEQVVLAAPNTTILEQHAVLLKDIQGQVTTANHRTSALELQMAETKGILIGRGDIKE